MWAHLILLHFAFTALSTHRPVCQTLMWWLKLAAALQQRSSCAQHRALSGLRATSVFTRLLHGDPQSEPGATLLSAAGRKSKMLSLCDGLQGSSPACRQRC